MSYKVIIIDDEPLAISVIRSYLNDFPEMEITDECHNGYEGLQSVQKHQPDLIFLDIQMPKINGFEMLSLLDNPPFVIFTTAFDEFAIKAFELNALDYLMKPFSKERFSQALSKFINRTAENSGQPLQQIASSVEYPQQPMSRIVVKAGNDIRIVPLEEIKYIEAYDDYIKINIEGDCFLKKQTMAKTESMLPESEFIRVHRSFILNLNQVNRIELSGKDSYTAILRDQSSIPLSRSGYSKLKSALGI